MAIQNGPLTNKDQTAFMSHAHSTTFTSWPPTHIKFNIAPSTIIHPDNQDGKKDFFFFFFKRSAPYHFDTRLLSSTSARNLFGTILDLWVTLNRVTELNSLSFFLFFFSFLEGPSGSGLLLKRITHFGKQPLVFFCFGYMCSYLCWVIKEPHIIARVEP